MRTPTRTESIGLAMLLFIVGCSKTDPKTISMAAAASRGHAVAAYRIESQADFGSYEVTQVWAFKRSNSNKYPYIIVEFSGPHISEEPRFKLDQEGLIYLGLVGYTDNSFREVWQSPTGIPDTLVVERNLEDAFAGVFSVDRNEPSSRF